jgi:integrase/recombinase XerD
MRRLRRSRYLSDDELARFMDAVRGRKHVNAVRDLAFFTLLANTGIRPSEALALTRADVHPHARPPWIRVARLKKRGGPRLEEIQLTPAIALCLAPRVYDLPADQGARLFAMTPRQSQRLFHYYAHKAGIRHGHLYILRHTAATRLYRSTRDIELVQAMLGHESPDTTAIYAHIPRSVLIETANKVPVFV